MKSGESKDRTAIIVAAIGGAVTLLAAFIGLCNPIVTRLADTLFNSAHPTATVTLVAAAPTATWTTAPTATAASSPTAVSKPSAVPSPLPTFALPQSGGLTFVLASNSNEPRDFYIDGAFVTRILPAHLVNFPVPAGAHHFSDCPIGKNPAQDTSECSFDSDTLDANPTVWEIEGNAQPQSSPRLIVAQTGPAPADVYVDGKLEGTVRANNYLVVDVSPGSHTVQDCNVGVTPTQPDTTCGTPMPIPVNKAFVFQTFNDQS